MKDKQRHQLLDAVRELVGHPDMNRGDADLAWLREVGEGLYNASEHTIHSQLEGGRLAGIQRRLGVLPASKEMTPAEFVELAQELLARPSAWTEDENWVLATLRDVARVRPGRCVPQVVADHMRVICSPCPPAPGQRDPTTNLSAQCGHEFRPAGSPVKPSADVERAYWDFDQLRRISGSARSSFRTVVRALLAGEKVPPPPPRVVKPDPSAKLLEAWLGIVRENREWLGIEPGSTSFGPIRDPFLKGKWRTRTLRAEYEFPMLRPAQMSDIVEGRKVYIEAAHGCVHRRVTAVYIGDYTCGTWGYYETTPGRKFVHFPKEVFVDNVPPPLFCPIGLADLAEGREVFVFDGDSLRKVSAFCLRHAGPAKWGYLEELTDGPEGRSVFREFTDDITICVKVKENPYPPPGYREIDLAEMSVGDKVFVRLGDCLREVVVTKRPNETGEVRLGHVHYTAGGWKFSEFTSETYVKERSEK